MFGTANTSAANNAIAAIGEFVLGRWGAGVGGCFYDQSTGSNTIIAY